MSETLYNNESVKLRALREHLRARVADGAYVDYADGDFAAFVYDGLMDTHPSVTVKVDGFGLVTEEPYIPGQSVDPGRFVDDTPFECDPATNADAIRNAAGSLCPTCLEPSEGEQVPDGAIQADRCGAPTVASFREILGDYPDDYLVITYPEHPGMVWFTRPADGAGTGGE